MAATMSRGLCCLTLLLKFAARESNIAKKLQQAGTFFNHPRIYIHEPMRATQPNKARLTKAS